MKSSSHVFRHLSRDTERETTGTYFTVVISRKRPRYLAGQSHPFKVKTQIVFMDIVSAPSAQEAAVDTLMYYFTQWLIRRWATAAKPVPRGELMEISEYAYNLTRSAIERIGTPTEMMTFLVAPWGIDHGPTVHHISE